MPSSRVTRRILSRYSPEQSPASRKQKQRCPAPHGHAPPGSSITAYSQLTPSLPRGYSEVTQRLLQDCSEITQRLLRGYSEGSPGGRQKLPRGHSEGNHWLLRLLRGYSEVTQRIPRGSYQSYSEVTPRPLMGYREITWRLLCRYSELINRLLLQEGTQRLLCSYS